jgi:hypothetical protein
MSDLDDRVRDIRDLERPGDVRIGLLAESQHGVVASWQLRRLGYAHDAIQRRATAGRLHRIYRGVYAVGHRRLTPRRGRFMAAVLACGPDAVLSHRAAATLWDLRPGTGSNRIDVTVPGRTRHSHDGIVVHNVRTLDGHDHVTLDGIPVTSLHRTLLDYAEVSLRSQLVAAFEAADRQQLLDYTALNDLLARSPGRRGRKPLAAVAAEYRGSPPDTRSPGEDGFLALIRDTSAPEPSVNVVVEGFLVDFYWPQERLVVEFDGFGYHRSRESFERDRVMDITLRRAGIGVLRITDRRINSEPHVVRADVLQALSAARGGAA